MKMADKFKVQLSARATKDFKDIQRYTLKTYGDKQVWRYTRLLKDGIEKLQQNPSLYAHARPDIPQTHRACKIGEHSLICRIEGQIIYIVAILHKRMDFISQLKI